MIILRVLALLLIRGRDAEYIRLDLMDMFARDCARGVSRWRAHGRYARRLIASAWQIWRRGPREEAQGSTWRGTLRHALRGGSMFQDMRFGLRLLRKHWAPVSLAIGGLALSLGVVSSVFSIIDASMLRPYGMDDPATVFSVARPWDGRTTTDWPYERFLRMHEDATLSRVEASRTGQVAFGVTADAEAYANRRTLFVSEGYLQMLGGRPLLGRPLEPADAVPGAPPVMMVSHRLWTEVLDADPDAVGQSFWLNGTLATLVGVMRPGFTGPVEVFSRPSVWVPLAIFDDVLGGPPFDASSTEDVEVVTRLAPESSPQGVQANLTAIVQRASAAVATPDPARPQPTVLLQSAASPMAGYKAGENYVAVISFFLLVGLVLAVACANTANLLLAAASTRRGEMGVRLALGATTGRLVRQMITESLLLGAVAGGLGCLLAFWLVPMLGGVLALSPEFSAAPDGRVLLFTVTIALLCGFGAGLSPARFGARGNVASSLKSQSGSAATPPPSRLRTSFVGFQAAVSIFLLVAAGLFARQAMVMMAVEPGFEAGRLLSVSVEAPGAVFDEGPYFRQAKLVLEGLPSVERVSLSEYPPFDWFRDVRRFQAEGRSYEVNVTHSDADFFQTTGIRLLRGRTFTAAEVAAGAPVAVISETVARGLFGDRDPVGAPLIGVAADRNQQERPIVIGIVTDAILTPFYSQEYGGVFVPIKGPAVEIRRTPPSLLVRVRHTGAGAREIESALQIVDSRVRPSVARVEEGLERFFRAKREFALITVPAALLVLLLATLGVFGISAFTAGQRAQEISLRMAIGASSNDVLRLLLKDGLRPVLAGLAVGLVMALAAGRVFSRQFSGISPSDPAAIVLATAILLVSAVVAVILPARGSARTDPASQLRHS